SAKIARSRNPAPHLKIHFSKRVYGSPHLVFGNDKTDDFPPTPKMRSRRGPLTSHGGKTAESGANELNENHAKLQHDDRGRAHCRRSGATERRGETAGCSLSRTSGTLRLCG